LVEEDLGEATQLIANAAFAQIQQHGDEMGERERSLAGEIRGADSRGFRKFIGKQEFLYGHIKEFKFA